MAYTVTDLANWIYQDMDENASLSVAFIASWVRSKIGNINNLLLKSFAIDESTLEFSPTLSMDEISIFQKIFEVYWYGKLIRDNLGASSFNAILEVQSDGAIVRRASPNATATIYVNLKKIATEELNKLINGYKSNSVSPLQVVGYDNLTTTDTINQYNGMPTFETRMKNSIQS